MLLSKAIVTPPSQVTPLRLLRNPLVIGVVLLCLPVILSTALFLVGVLSLPFRDSPRFDPFQQTTTNAWLDTHVLWPIVGWSFMAAAYGPACLPFAAILALAATRRMRVSPRATILVWMPVVLGLAATAVFWGWLIDLEIVP